MSDFFKLVTAEVERCRKKFPSNKNVLLALQEELGETTQAVLEGRLDDAKLEITQVAALCLRFFEEGDASFYGEKRYLAPIEVVETRSEVERVLDDITSLIDNSDVSTSVLILDDESFMALLNASDDEITKHLDLCKNDYGERDIIATLINHFGVCDVGSSREPMTLHERAKGATSPDEVCKILKFLREVLVNGSSKLVLSCALSAKLFNANKDVFLAGYKMACAECGPCEIACVTRNSAIEDFCRASQVVTFARRTYALDYAVNSLTNELLGWADDLLFDDNFDKTILTSEAVEWLNNYTKAKKPKSSPQRDRLLNQAFELAYGPTLSWRAAADGLSTTYRMHEMGGLGAPFLTTVVEHGRMDPLDYIAAKAKSQMRALFMEHYKE